jgi:hypothetical protein
VYIAASEFAAAAREYVVVFARDGRGHALPTVLLGLTTDQNLIVDANGRWQGNYIPAYVRRYPFILSSTDPASQQFTVCIDEAYSGFNTAKEGEQLIDDDGGHGALLAKSVKFLQDFHQHTLLTASFCEAVDKAGLFEPMQAEISLSSGAKYALSGFMCVRREKLPGLGAERAKEFLDKGFLELIYLHIHSLANLDRLMQLAQPPAATAKPQARRRGART